MIAIPAGMLNRQVTLMQQNPDQDPDTGDQLPPVHFVTVWAQVKPMSGSELYRAQQFVDEATILVVIRFLDGVTSDMTVQYGEQSFQVLAVLNELEANVQMNLLCKAINQ